MTATLYQFLSQPEKKTRNNFPSLALRARGILGTDEQWAMEASFSNSSLANDEVE
ncbi:uncharacterized protein G2W53_030027 [Senna tora]|uniref:Uncharacterized protein n=1 Tax=Senna tora TaxID=362788 RepID=A0A834T6J7_9FABA|nr:uncharacterized protein G2W53_030027 [Senna tora]